MRKSIAILLVFVMLTGLCACASGQGQSAASNVVYYSIQCNDGTTKQMTAKQIVDMYNNDGRNFENLLKGALISGTGTVSRVYDISAANWTYPDKIPCAWGGGVSVENGKVSVSTFFAPKDNYIKLYKGDEVYFQGKLSVSDGVVCIGTHYQMEDTYLRYAG